MNIKDLSYVELSFRGLLEMHMEQNNIKSRTIIALARTQNINQSIIDYFMLQSYYNNLNTIIIILYY